MTPTPTQIEAAAKEFFDYFCMNSREIAEWENARLFYMQAAKFALTAAAEVGGSIECDQCGGSGFDTLGTGYGNVCSKCGGSKYHPVSALELALKQDKLEPIIQHAVSATIERCAQVAETYDGMPVSYIAAAIRALKDK